MYLSYSVRAHPGHIGLVDYDKVELGNLHRQVLHTEERIGGKKSESIAQAVSQYV